MRSHSSLCVAIFAFWHSVAAIQSQSTNESDPDKFTILRFEIQNPGKPLDAEKLIESIKRRIGSAENYNIVVRPTGNVVELQFPKVATTKNLTEADVQQVKDLVSRVGRLEFRVLANEQDDKEAMEEAEKHLNKPDAEARKQLVNTAIQGLAPPMPVKQYEVKLVNGTKAKFFYTWVELSRANFAELGLDRADDPRMQTLAKQRDRAVRLTSSQEKHAVLLFSRLCTASHMSEKERAKKGIECFVLCRGPKLDPASTTAQPLVKDVKGTVGDKDASGKITFQFNDKGADLFGELVRSNISPSTAASVPRRHLAVILDGQVHSMPEIRKETETRVKITGTFTKDEVDRLVRILEGGSLPVQLKHVLAVGQREK